MSDPRAELIRAVFELVQDYRNGESSIVLMARVRVLVSVWEKHPRKELRELLRDRTN